MKVKELEVGKLYGLGRPGRMSLRDLRPVLVLDAAYWHVPAFGDAPVKGRKSTKYYYWKHTQDAYECGIPCAIQTSTGGWMPQWVNAHHLAGEWSTIEALRRVEQEKEEADRAARAAAEERRKQAFTALTGVLTSLVGVCGDDLPGSSLYNSTGWGTSVSFNTPEQQVWLTGILNEFMAGAGAVRSLVKEYEAKVAQHADLFALLDQHGEDEVMAAIEDYIYDMED